MNGPNGNGWTTRYASILQTVSVVGIFVGGFWAAVIVPMGKSIEKIEKNYVSLREFEQFKTDIVAKLDALSTEVEKIRDSEVTRSEHQEHWSDTDQRIEALAKRVDQMETEYQMVYGPNDALKAMQKQIDDLRVQLAQPEKKQ
jgi:predicted RNase H-like nuclease (RuvC/YqgF family)